MTEVADVRAAFRSDVGMQREGNEDACYAGAHVFAVADGLGGHRAGEVASELALEHVAKLDSLDAPKAARQAADGIRRANRAVFERASGDPALQGMGTTMTVVVLDAKAKRAQLAHVGDSRAYLLRGGSIMQISRDHTLVARMVEEGKLTQQQADEHPQRSILTRALGADRDVEIEESTISLADDDRLLLCSDGLTGVLSDDDIARIAAEGSDLEEKCQALVDEANARGGPDNITVVIVDVGRIGATAAAPTPVAPQQRRRPVRPVYERRRITARPFIWLAAILAAVVGIYIGARALTSNNYYVGLDGDEVAIFQGLPVDFSVLHLSTVREGTGVKDREVAPSFLPRLRNGVRISSLQAGRDYVLHELPRATTSPAPRATPKISPHPTASRT